MFNYYFKATGHVAKPAVKEFRGDEDKIIDSFYAELEIIQVDEEAGHVQRDVLINPVGREIKVKAKGV